MAGHNKPHGRPSPSTNFSWEPLQTPDEVAAYLRIHPKTVIRMARQKAIPALRLGKHWRFRNSDLTAWADGEVESRRQPNE
jgi:excisionase family DNA binding protein